MAVDLEKLHAYVQRLQRQEKVEAQRRQEEQEKVQWGEKAYYAGKEYSKAKSAAQTVPELLKVEQERSTQLWKAYHLFDDEGTDDDFERMYQVRPYQVKKEELVVPVAPVQRNRWLDEDSDSDEDSDDIPMTGICRKRENIFQTPETPEQEQKRKQEAEELRRFLKENEEKALAAEKKRMEQKQKEQKREEKHFFERKQSFVNQTVLEASKKFQPLSTEQENALGKLRRKSYNKKKAAWMENIEKQRELAEQIFALKEVANHLYRQTEYSKYEYSELRDQHTEADVFAPEKNQSLATGAYYLYCEDMMQLHDQNKVRLHRLKKINDKCLVMQAELEKLKEQQGFPVSKKKPHTNDFLGNLEHINHHLRVGAENHERLDPRLSVSAEATQEQMKMHPIGKQMVVHKSMNRQEWAEMRGREMKETDTLVKYKCFRDKGFCKASLQEEEADDIQLVIAVDANAWAMRIPGNINDGKEGVLLPQNTEYYIVKEERYVVNWREKTRVFLAVGTT